MYSKSVLHLFFVENHQKKMPETSIVIVCKLHSVQCELIQEFRHFFVLLSYNHTTGINCQTTPRMCMPLASVRAAGSSWVVQAAEHKYSHVYNNTKFGGSHQ